MLSILDDFVPAHDPMTRREWIRVGSLGAGGLSLPLLNRNRAVASNETPVGSAFGRAKSVILFFLNGGPPQQETWDLKPEAASEFRGPFTPIATKTPGLDVCELMPQTAMLTDKIAVLRAMATNDSSHSSSGYQMLTGVPHIPLSRESVTAKAPNLWPCVGSIVRTLRPPKNGLPASVVVPEHIWNDGNIPWPGQDAGFLGRKYDPWLIHCNPSDENFKIPDLAFPNDVSQLRFDRRQALLTQVNRHLDSIRQTQAVGEYNENSRQALDLLSGSRSREAFDLSREPKETRDRYGRSRYAQSVLLARRLVEAGVSLVRINWTRVPGKENQGGWDTHAKNAESLKTHLMPIMDRAYSALIEDLDQRGLLDETLVVWLGEFGRTPRINRRAGRDHWGKVFSVALAGGGIKGGRFYGASDRNASFPVAGRVSAADLTATIFHCLGYEPDSQIHDTLGRALPISRGNVIDQIL